MSKTAIKLHQLSKDFVQGKRNLRTNFREIFQPLASKQVIKNISLQIKAKKTVGIYGPNGSGKSTLLRLIAGILQPDKGEIEVSGKVAAVIELGSGFNPELTGRENYRLYSTLLGMSQQLINNQFAKVLKFSGLGGDIDLPVKQYSSGMRTRLAFSAAAFSDADILLLDEVFAVGDREFLDQSRMLMKKLKKSKTILLTSHNTALLHDFCDEVIKLEKGSLVEKNKLFKFFLDIPEGEEFITKVSSNSMYPLLKKDDLIKVTKIPFDKLKVGDTVAVFVESIQEIVVHRLVSSTKNNKTGRKEFSSKGDNSFEQDKWSINADNYVGLVEKVAN
jgi:ABC-type polysaccharide/polyol phosphate transport system ATPase subunit